MEKCVHHVSEQVSTLSPAQTLTKQGGFHVGFRASTPADEPDFDGHNAAVLILIVNCSGLSTKGERGF